MDTYGPRLTIGYGTTELLNDIGLTELAHLVFGLINLNFTERKFKGLLGNVLRVDTDTI